MLRDLAEDEWVSVDLLVHHAAEDSHHGSTALVEFLSTKLQLLFFIGASEETNRVDGATKVTREGSFGLLPETELHHTDETDNLGDTGRANCGDGGETSRDVSKLGSREVNVSRKAVSLPGDVVSEESKLRDTAVLNLNVTKTIKSVLITISYQVEGIEETKRFLSTKLFLESLEGSGRSRLGRRGKSRSGGKEGGNNSELHLGSFNVLTNVWKDERIFIVLLHSKKKDTLPGFVSTYVRVVPIFYGHLKL
jgi:hypothetical protein